jgi:hypothetical protein
MSEPRIQPTTPEEDAWHARLATLAEQDKDDILERMRLHDIAAAQPTFVGRVLRAILCDTEVSTPELALLAGVDFVTFDDFRCGRITLPPDAFERVARRMGFTLVRQGEPVGT